MSEQVERRRSPRVAVPSGHAVQVPVTTRVVLLDISASGVCVAGTQALPAETRGELKTMLNTGPFVGQVSVARTFRVSDKARPEGMGVKFVGVDEASAKALTAFLQKAST